MCLNPCVLCLSQPFVLLKSAAVNGGTWNPVLQSMPHRARNIYPLRHNDLRSGHAWSVTWPLVIEETTITTHVRIQGHQILQPAKNLHGISRCLRFSSYRYMFICQIKRGSHSISRQRNAKLSNLFAAIYRSRHTSYFNPGVSDAKACACTNLTCQI